ncbi:hypothetical protein ELQ35_07950 [Peribacillus cavernae]|uniref:YkyB-like protein n=1 Tax=Peribacillus cavernae TaxID=1674310 RepID=A0A433HPT9_9BACI|nr:YkyB family protein [Peribacillus cavernae]MDQ0217271.1 hypothetical protein [Peribacillus cavernae]RUQ30262.1 hypothetical protein ELQ35_07950 [Peribacillus cavernae]
MRQTEGQSSSGKYSVNFLAQAIFIVNKHAKTAPEPKYLYNLKRISLDKMLKEGKAQKKGLHFSDNPRFSAQQSDVIIQCGDFIFHLPPTRDDLKTLPHLGSRTAQVRNPKAALSLSKAKQILQEYVGKADDLKGDRTPALKKNHAYGTRQKHTIQNPFPSTFLGKGFKY